MREWIRKVQSSRWFCTPITARPCVRPRWRFAWTSWVCSGRSHGQGSQMTTRTPNPCSGQSSIGLIIPASPCLQRGGLRVGYGVRRLVQPPAPAPSQCHPIRDTRSAPQRIGRCHFSTACRCLRESPQSASDTLESTPPLHASTR